MSSTQQTPTHRGTRPRWALAGILVLAALLRLVDLGRQPLWLDEAYTWEAAVLFNQGGIRPLAELDHIAPGYYLVAGLVARVAGYGTWSLRLVSTLAGIVAVYLMHQLALAITNHGEVALWSAGFLAVAPMAVWYSQEARGYSLLLALTLGYLLLTWRHLNQTGWRRLAGIALLAAAMVWVHQFALFVFAAMGLLVLLRFGFGRGLWQWLAAHVVACLLFVPWLVLSWARMQRQLALPPTAIWSRIPYNLMTLLAGQSYGPSIREIRELGIKQAGLDHLGALGLLALCLLLVALAAWRGRRLIAAGTWAWLGCLLVVPNLALLAASLLTHNLYHARYLITTLPAVALCFGLMASWWRRDRVAAVATVLSAMVVAWSLAGHYLDPSHAKEDNRLAPATLAAQMGPDDMLLVANPLATPAMYPYGFSCPARAETLLGPEGLDGLAEGTITPGASTFTVETRQWETVPSDQLDQTLDDLLGAPRQVWQWNGVRVTQRAGALAMHDAPGLRTGC